MHNSTLKAYLRGTFPEVRDIDDVVQESYLRLLKARAKYPIRSVKAFLFHVARCLAIDGTRHAARSPVDSLPDLTTLEVAENKPGVAETVSLNEEVALLARALDTLPTRCREVMYLRQIDGVSQKEIALRLGISELTVQTHVVQGIRRLRKFFREQEKTRHRP